MKTHIENQTCRTVTRFGTCLWACLIFILVFWNNRAFAQEVELNVVTSLSQNVAQLTRGKGQINTMRVRNFSSRSLKINTVKFEPSNLDSPKEANEIKVAGLDHVTLARDASTEFFIILPAHENPGEYEGTLYYSKSDKPSDYTPFYSFTVRIVDPAKPLMSQIFAAIVATILGLAIVFLTFQVTRMANKEMGFFQSPSGSYSASKFQIWLWTVVIIFSFVYVFLRRGAVIEFPESIWWLLGISVGSTGTAKFITVSKLNKQEESDNSTISEKEHYDSNAERLASLLSEKGHLSLMRLQMFGWTVVTSLLFIVHVIRSEQLWDVPTGLLVLMGISHAGYLGDKSVELNPKKKEPPENKKRTKV